MDENDDLYQRIRAGDSTAIDEMILGNLPLVEKRLRLFLKDYRRFRHLRDDLYGEAILALTEVVSSFAEREADKPTSYIVSRINFAMKNFVSSECGHGLMSRRTVQRRRTSGESLPELLPFDPAEPPARLWRNASGRIVPKQIDSDADDGFGRPTKISHADAEQFIDNYALNDDSPSDLLDQVLACCESAQERMIVRLRLQGYTDEEISEQIGVPRPTVNRRRHEIEERFDRMKKTPSE